MTEKTEFAVIKTGGKQYTVSPGEAIVVDSLLGAEGDTVTFDTVLLYSDGNETKAGTPELSGASVSGKILKTGRKKKIVIFKKTRRQGYRNRNGHRQDYSRVLIESISG